MHLQLWKWRFECSASGSHFIGDVILSPRQVPRLRRALPPSHRPPVRRGRDRAHRSRSARLRILVPPRAENRPGAGLLLHGGPRLLAPLSQHVFHPRGTDLCALLHRRGVHRVPLGHALHLPHFPHRRVALPLPGAAHHLLRGVLHDGLPRVLPRFPVGGPGGVQRRRSREVPGLDGDSRLPQ